MLRRSFCWVEAGMSIRTNTRKIVVRPVKRVIVFPPRMRDLSSGPLVGLNWRGTNDMRRIRC